MMGNTLKMANYTRGGILKVVQYNNFNKSNKTQGGFHVREKTNRPKDCATHGT